MADKQVIVCSLRTWGQLGNRLAGKTLCRSIKRFLPEVQAMQILGEDLIPLLESYGNRIREISRTARDASELYERYMYLIAEIDSAFPTGFERADAQRSAAIRAILKGAAAFLKDRRPDLVIATKGFLGRLMFAAMNEASLSTPLIVYVSNPGLLSLPIHRSQELAYLVGFEHARDDLVKRYGIDASKVLVTGPLISSAALKNSLPNQPAEHPCVNAPIKPKRPGIVLYSNYGGEAYLRFFESVLTSAVDHDIVFILGDDQNRCDQARKMADSLEPSNRRVAVFSGLDQGSYLDLIRDYASIEGSFLITKSGPNTVLEAANIGLPVLAHRSGLPMEEWVENLVNEQGIGQAFPYLEELENGLQQWIDSPHIVRRCRANALAYKKNVLNGAYGEHKIAKAVSGFL
jgi:UDP-N-acetylglucosamine:LPS N-acetylglucosamine transferase